MSEDKRPGCGVCSKCGEVIECPECRDVSEPSLTDLLELIASSAYIAYSHTLNGAGIPAHIRYFERMRHPEVGDLVLESTTMSRASAIDRIGRLKAITLEPLEGWDDIDEPTPNEKVWTITTMDGREFKWRNADFIVIPEDPFKHQGK